MGRMGERNGRVSAEMRRALYFNTTGRRSRSGLRSGPPPITQQNTTHPCRPQAPMPTIQAAAVASHASVANGRTTLRTRSVGRRVSGRARCRARLSRVGARCGAWYGRGQGMGRGCQAAPGEWAVARAGARCRQDEAGNSAAFRGRVPFPLAPTLSSTRKLSSRPRRCIIQPG